MKLILVTLVVVIMPSTRQKLLEEVVASSLHQGSSLSDDRLTTALKETFGLIIISKVPPYRLIRSPSVIRHFNYSIVADTSSHDYSLSKLADGSSIGTDGLNKRRGWTSQKGINSRTACN